MKPENDNTSLVFFCSVLGGLGIHSYYNSLTRIDALLFVLLIGSLASLGLLVFMDQFSKAARERKKAHAFKQELPEGLVKESTAAVRMGIECDLKIPIYLPDSIRSRHVHIIGATGSGKTESVVLNFIKQDVTRGLGAIILDAKGDSSFIESLKEWVPSDRLEVFDLGSEQSRGYNPLLVGTPIEASQRLFASLIWSEEYYASKARAALLVLFDNHFRTFSKNPTLSDLNLYLKSPASFAAVCRDIGLTPKMAEKEFMDLSGLRDQIASLCTGYLSSILSPETNSIDLSQASTGKVIYFRLQSLMSPKIVATVGKLLINHLSYIAGSVHRLETPNISAGLIPTYLDEFATFACPEFADLISKARSAGLALHFSHQSLGDLEKVDEGFVNQITDNSATKIVLRISDPDSAEFFARSFGTKLYQKVTQRITNAKEADMADLVGEGSQREAHQFRAAPDLFKTLPTGIGSVLIAHGEDTPHGGSTVLKIKFPRLQKVVKISCAIPDIDPLELERIKHFIN